MYSSEITKSRRDVHLDILLNSTKFQIHEWKTLATHKSIYLKLEHPFLIFLTSTDLSSEGRKGAGGGSREENPGGGVKGAARADRCAHC